MKNRKGCAITALSDIEKRVKKRVEKCKVWTESKIDKLKVYVANRCRKY